MTPSQSNTRDVADFIVSMRNRELPPEVLDTARLCLADWMGVAIGAADEPAALIVRDTAGLWESDGRSHVLLGGKACAPVAALCNGTLAHCLDFDDTYVKGVTHISAPVWAATLAVGESVEADEDEILTAYIAGFETAARAGYGLGELVTARGFHGTGVFGRIGAAASACVLLALDADAVVNALGAAATQASGLAASFGTMAKPFHAGKAAMDGIIAAQLAQKGFRAADSLLDPGAGLDNALVQDRAGSIRPADFSAWEILNNSFKPYAACHLTHPAIDAARAIRTQRTDATSAHRYRAHVGALAKQVTGEKNGLPATALEGKFDLKYCVALALHGHAVSAADFREPFQLDPRIAATARRIEVIADDRYAFASASLSGEFDAAARLTTEITVAKGHPGNPIGWQEMRDKFNGLMPSGGRERASRLFESLRSFGTGKQTKVMACAAALIRTTD
jgi:2-methylcitrate dehydratase PrpD